MPIRVLTGDDQDWVLVLRFDAEKGSLSIDSTFHERGTEGPEISFNRTQWPHGKTGPAVVHGALFGRGNVNHNGDLSLVGASASASTRGFMGNTSITAFNLRTSGICGSIADNTGAAVDRRLIGQLFLAIGA